MRVPGSRCAPSGGGWAGGAWGGGGGGGGVAPGPPSPRATARPRPPPPKNPTNEGPPQLTHRKPVWAALAAEAVGALQGGQFTALSQREARAVLEGRRLGVARLRLLPKRTGGGRVWLSRVERGSVRRLPTTSLSTPLFFLPPHCTPHRAAHHCEPRRCIHSLLSSPASAPGRCAPGGGGRGGARGGVPPQEPAGASERQSAQLTLAHAHVCCVCCGCARPPALPPCTAPPSPPAGAPAAGVKRGRRGAGARVKLQFRPVNSMLQSVYQVWGGGGSDV